MPRELPARPEAWIRRYSTWIGYSWTADCLRESPRSALRFVDHASGDNTCRPRGKRKDSVQYRYSNAVCSNYPTVIIISSAVRSTVSRNLGGARQAVNN
jgi:hypothetical protein